MCQLKRSKSDLTKVYLGLGSNIGDRQGNLSMSVKLLSEQINVERVSSLYETEPVGYLEQPKFLNAVLRSTTHLAPERLLALIKDIEKSLGRVSSFVNAPRPIDIDILFYGMRVISSPQLTIPHPRLEERAFVLVPLAEIAPNLRHPVSRRTVSEMIQKVAGLEGVKKYKQEIKNV